LGEEIVFSFPFEGDVDGLLAFRDEESLFIGRPRGDSGGGRGVVYIDCYPICKVEVVVDIGCYCYESMFSILYCG
jgi:hypothetical protein